MENKNTAILIVLSSLILLTAMIGATFAYFTAQIVGEQSKVELHSAVLANATAEGVPVFLEISPKDMNQIDSSNNYESYIESDEPGLLKLSVNSGTSKVECTYDIVYVPNKVYYRSVSNVNSLMEFTILGKQSVIKGSNFVKTSGEMNEVDLTDVQSSIKLVSGAKFIVNKKDTEAQVIWEIIPRYYNLEVVQDDNSGKTFGGSVEVGSLVCLNK